MTDKQDNKEVKPEAPKSESQQKVDSKPQPRELTAAEINAVAAAGYWAPSAAIKNQ